MVVKDLLLKELRKFDWLIMDSFQDQNLVSYHKLIESGLVVQLESLLSQYFLELLLWKRRGIRLHKAHLLEVEVLRRVSAEVIDLDFIVANILRHMIWVWTVAVHHILLTGKSEFVLKLERLLNLVNFSLFLLWLKDSERGLWVHWPWGLITEFLILSIQEFNIVCRFHSRFELKMLFLRI